MSGAKGGTIAIIPALFGAAALIPLAAVSGIVAGVNMIVEAKRKVEKECREAELKQHQATLSDIDLWLKEISAHQESTSTGGRAASAQFETSVPISTGLTTPSLERERINIAALCPSEDVSSALIRAMAADNDLRQIIVKLKQTLEDTAFSLPADIYADFNRLKSASTPADARHYALQIYPKINAERKKIEDEKREAQQILAELPIDFPEELRTVLQNAAAGSVRFDTELRTMIADARTQFDELRRKCAAAILRDTLTGMKYETSGINESLFVSNGTVYIRDQTWADGYCVKIGVTGNDIKFFVQKDGETDETHDAVVEQEWKDGFSRMQKELGAKGIKIDVQELSAPGKAKVPKGRDIPIATRSSAPSVQEPTAQTELKGGETPKNKFTARRKA